jgi:hypothetical protein
MRSSRLVTLFLLAALGLAGCASSPPASTQDFVRAQTLIEQAERNQAQQFAAADLDRAREKLTQSKAAINAKKPEMANRYATEAAVDAELALARSSMAQAEKSAQEVSDSVDQLRNESQRAMRP